MSDQEQMEAIGRLVTELAESRAARKAAVKAFAPIVEAMEQCVIGLKSDMRSPAGSVDWYSRKLREAGFERATEIIENVAALDKSIAFAEAELRKRGIEH